MDTLIVLFRDVEGCVEVVVDGIYEEEPYSIYKKLAGKYNVYCYNGIKDPTKDSNKPVGIEIRPCKNLLENYSKFNENRFKEFKLDKEEDASKLKSKLNYYKSINTADYKPGKYNPKDIGDIIRFLEESLMKNLEERESWKI